MKFIINSGHTLVGKGTGAVGYINESKETRAVTKEVIRLLKDLGHTVIDCTIDKSSNYLKEAVGAANKHSGVDLAISIHFNAGGGTGVETLVYNNHTTPNKYADRINKEIASTFNFKNRGVKQRSDLYWLKATTAKAILIECCFVDSKEDTTKYNANKMAAAIVKGLIGTLPNNNSNNNTSSHSGLYAVCVGAYNKTNANNMLAEIKAKGYKDAYLISR